MSGRADIEKVRKISENENVCVFVRGYSSAGSKFVREIFPRRKYWIAEKTFGKGAECGRKAFCEMEGDLRGRQA